MSAIQYYNLPVVPFEGGKDSDAATGDISGVSHAKGTKLAYNTVLGSAAKVGRGVRGGWWWKEGS